MGVENDLLPAKKPEVDSSTTALPDDHNIHLATRRISQFERRISLALMVLLAMIADQQPAHSQVTNSDSLNPASDRNLIVTGDIPSEQAYQTLLTPYPASKSEEKASAQVEDLGVGHDYTRTYIDPLGNRIKWRVLNGTDGIPPNNPDHSIDKIFVSVNDSEAKPFQFNEAQFPSDTYHIAVGGHWMDTKLNIAYVPLEIAKNSTGGRTLPYIGIVLDAKNATRSPVLDPAKQKLITDLPQGGAIGDAFKYFKVDSDNNGMFIKFGIQQSINPKEDGDYMIRLDNNGLPIGGTVKIESVTMTRRQFLPFVATGFSGK